MSNFTQYKIKFNNDTGIKADANIPLYILYIECIKNGITYTQYKSQFFNETGLSADGNKEIYLNWIIANFVNGGSGTVVHNDTTERDAEDAHPISAITNLQGELDDKADTDSLATVATSGSYNDLSDTPTHSDKRTEWVSLVLMYQGFAPVGSAEDSAVWTIYKIVTLATGGVVSNTEFTNKKWTERNLL